jgi:oxalate decarboxylase
MFSRRELLAASAMGAAIGVSATKAGSFGNPDEPPQGGHQRQRSRKPGRSRSAECRHRQSVSVGPISASNRRRRHALTWASFNNASKRIQDGGWAREVTVNDFAISKEIAGLNMRLTAGGIREPHWHQAAEWAIMTYGYAESQFSTRKGDPMWQT